ncbi:MAG TPA: hypothetical protein VKB93_06275 [Thermoanaerobaculia bacterium]|nr:hypothetical protein [Thermoanaerobaculia bacterium]
MTVPRAVAILLLFTATLHAIERPLTPPVHGPAAAPQYDASVASDGENYLVLWTDKRATHPELWGTRVAPDGRVLDPTGIFLRSGDVVQPAVVWSGTSYVIVWRNPGNQQTEILRVDRDGAIVDGPRSILNAYPHWIDVASNGSTLALVYTSAAGVRARILTADAEVIRDFPLVEEVSAMHPRVTARGSSFAAVWTATTPGSESQAILFNAEGTLQSEPRRIPDAIGVSEIATDGESFVVIAGSSGSLHARRLGADLSPIGPAVLLPDAFRFNTSLLWLGTHYGVIGDSGNEIFSIRLGRDAQLLDAQPVMIESPAQSGSQPAPAAATNGTDVLIAWNGAFVFDSRVSLDTSIDVYATLLSASTLSRETRTLLSISATRQIRPFLAASSTNLLAIWSEGTGLYAERLRFDGTPIDATPLRVFDAPANPVAAFNGTDYVVAWYLNGTVTTRRIARDGALRADGGGEFRVPLRDTDLAMTSNGTTTLMVMGALVSRLASDGSFVDAVPLQLTDTLLGGIAAAPDDRGGFLVTWAELGFRDPFYDTPIPFRVRASRILPSFTNADPNGFIVAEDGGDPAVTWNGREWVIVWSRGGIEGRRVSRDGVLLGNPFGIAGSGFRPNIAWDGARYAVTYDAATTPFGRFLLHAAWLPQLGAPLVNDRVLGEIEFGGRMRLPLAALGPGTVVATYARIAREPEFGGVTRAFVNVMNPPVTRRRVVR